MSFDKNDLPEWNAEGTVPPQEHKDSGWGTDEHPPADWFNWFFNRTYKALLKLFTNAQDKNEKGKANGYAALDENGKVINADGTSAGGVTEQEFSDLQEEVVSHLAEDASLTKKGHVQLSSATNSTSEALAATPKAVKDAVDNLQIGGRNYLLNSDNSKGLAYWRNWGTATNANRSIVDITDLIGIKKAFMIENLSGDGQWGYAQDNLKVLPNTTYTVSFWFKSTDATKVFIMKGNGSNDLWAGAWAPQNQIDGKWHRLTYTWTTSSDVTPINIYVGIDGGGKGKVFITGIKLEIGNKATDWSPAPEDFDAKIEQTSYKITKSGKDSNGIFTTVQYFRKSDGTLAQKSVLSGGTSPQYTSETVTYYGSDGTTVVKTETFTLSYDSDGDLISLI